jgi:4-aminobutyrate aminotransferase
MAGRRYMDFHGNNVHHVGYAHPQVIWPPSRHSSTRCRFAPRRFACDRAVELAEALSAHFQRLTGSPGRVLFTTGGSDAVEVAIKLARTATGRFKTLSFWDAFHGAGFGASSVGGESLFRGGRVGPAAAGQPSMSHPSAATAAPMAIPVDATGASRTLRALPPRVRRRW